MRADLDQLMSKRDLQAILVAGGEHENTIRAYLSNGIDIHGGITIKKRGSPPVMIVNSMEREEAAKSGLQVITWDDLGWQQLFKDAEGDYPKAYLGFYARIFERLDIPPGKIGVYGTGDMHVWIELVRSLEKNLPQYTFAGEIGLTLFDEAYVTKDADELLAIREVAAKTSDVLQATWDFISGHRADGDMLVKSDGTPLTIGDVKRFVNRELLDRGLEGANMIFAQGRDAGIPHSRGDNNAALKLGAPIIFDLFPRQIKGGYYHDCTRTWCIGYAPDNVQTLYNQAMRAFQIAVEAYAEPGQPTHTVQEAVLDYFESQGHPTQRSQIGTTNGYTHSLGHGVGLNIHERPSMHHILREDIFQKGNFVTIEPGLYYPDEGVGVRVEDSFIIDDAGALVSITDFHKELVLPLKG